MLEGAKIWYRDGKFPPCQRIDEAKQEYRQEMDSLAQFLAVCVRPASGSSIRATDLYECYLAWAKEEGLKYTRTSTKFGTKMKRKLKNHRGTSGIYYDHVELTEEGMRIKNKALSRL